MAVININGTELEADFYDADFVDKFESATKAMRDKAEEGRNVRYKSLGDAYRSQCRIAKEYVDAVFGEGTSDQVFGKADNIKVCLDAIKSLTDAAANLRKETNDMLNRYTQRQKAFQANQFKHGRKNH